ncbi:hypothetical protein EVAR_9528_1 [Eumeta japonica]|uniref:Uncharacterized protein n=1 Tax=Eumeta variegata TaxID=151549 RepID=A0A4C1U4B3_EUMVA|nr:hypothetical protein EVAR_9528_1 [Eumeta japonica]
MLLETIHAGGFSPDSRVRGHSLVQCGTNISRSAGPHDSWRPRGRTTGSGGTALDFLCRASTRIPERPHTMFRLLNIFLASSVLGRTARTSHNVYSSRAYVKLDFEVHEIFIETAESLNVWAVNFNAVVGGADGFTVVYPQTGAVCGYLRKLAPLRKKMGGSSLGLGGGLGIRPRSFGGHRLRGSGDWISG